MGRGPRDIRAHLIGDLLVVRLQGVLTAPEQQLVKTLPAEKGRDLLKQVRTHLIETARPVMEAMIQEVTGVKVLSLHHDISTVTGEEVVLFTLAESPDSRQRRNDRDYQEAWGMQHQQVRSVIRQRGKSRRPQPNRLSGSPAKSPVCSWSMTNTWCGSWCNWAWSETALSSG